MDTETPDTTPIDTETKGNADAVLLELLLTDEGKADPYPRYARLHESAPFETMFGAVVVTRFDDCNFVLRDNRFGKWEGGPREGFGMTPEQVAKVESVERAPSMLFLNPPDHTRLRGLVSKAFTPRTVEAMREHIVRLTDELLDRFPTDGTPIDIMAELAFPLPATVIGELLGVPAEDRHQFQGLVRAATKSLEASITEEEFDAALAASQTMGAYFGDLIAERRRHPQDDLLSELIAARDEGDRLSEDEIASTAILLFAAGFETTTNLIGNGLLALLRHPDQLQRLRDDPALLRPGVEELLRFDSPVQVDGRAAFADMEVGGYAIPAETMVLTLLGAANHDPSHFDDPGRLDVGRAQGAPMSFGAGIHYCLGAALARVEGQVVFGRLLERFSAVELCDHEPSYRPSLTLRGLVDLPVAVTAT